MYRVVKESALRDAEGVFLVESRLCVRRLLELGRHRVRSVFVTPVALEALGDLLDPDAAPFPIYLSSSELMKQVLGFNMHRGCVAAAERGETRTLDSLLQGPPGLVVGLEGVANPENVGNVFRNAAAFGAAAVLLSADCADPLYRKAIRVSMGGTLQTPFARIANWADSIPRLRAAGLSTLAFSTASAASPLSDVRREAGRGLALLFGSEDAGLCASTLAAADRRVRIPMADDVDSLNVATASGVALHHCFGL